MGALVTSCGDDETPTPTPTSSDSGTATPTPTSTATGGIVFSLTQDFAAGSSNANAVVAFFTPDGSTDEVFSNAARVNGAAAVEFVASPESLTFSFPDFTDPLVFTDADFDSLTATTRRYVRGDEALTVSLPFAEVLRITYDLEGQDFTRDTVDGTLRSKRTSLFFNPVTTTDDITVALTYTGSAEVFGGDPGVTPAGVLTLTATDLTITPGATASDADTVSITLTVFETVGMTQTQVASIVITGDLGTNGTFFGDISDATNSLTGEFAGSLAGDNREEAFLIFSVSDDDPDDDDDRRFVGTWIGER